jgi:predicted nuclease of predicted toxin-antitoxin system
VERTHQPRTGPAFPDHPPRARLLSPFRGSRTSTVRLPAAVLDATSIPDLLIAAIAEKAGLTVLAADKDFNVIAAITGQPVETLAD